jgi:hypothetical protein
MLIYKHTHVYITNEPLKRSGSKNIDIGLRRSQSVAVVEVEKAAPLLAMQALRGEDI